MQNYYEFSYCANISTIFSKKIDFFTKIQSFHFIVSLFIKIDMKEVLNHQNIIFVSPFKIFPINFFIY